MTAIDHIRLSQQAKDQLIKLKRVTGIEHWNVLCRWALCVSADRTAQDCDFPHGTITSHKTRHRRWPAIHRPSAKSWEAPRVRASNVSRARAAVFQRQGGGRTGQEQDR